MDQKSPQEQFYDIISTLLSQDNSSRAKAEMEVNEILKASFEDAIFNLAEFIKNESLDCSIRLMCCTIAKNSLNHSLGKEEWLKIPLDKREIIKNNILSCLGSEKNELRRISASVVSSIAKIDMPLNNWPSLITTLINVTDNSDINFVLSALITIGILCEDINEEDFSEEQKQKMLECSWQKLFIQKINNSDIIYQAAYAFSFQIKFFSDKMQTSEFRINIFSNIIDLFNRTEAKIQILLLQILSKIVSTYYDLVSDEMLNIIKFISSLTKNSSDDIVKHAYFFWLSIISEELNRKKNFKNTKNMCYCQKYFSLIWNDIKQTLIERMPPTIDDREDYCSFDVCYTLLEYLSMILKSDYITDIFKFIGECLGSSTDKLKIAAIYSFTAILEGDWKDKISETIPDSISSLITLLASNNLELQIQSAKCLSSICKNYTDILTSKTDLLNNIINSIIQILKNNSKKLNFHICLCVHNLAKSCKFPLNQVSDDSILGNYLQDLLKVLTSVAYSNDACNPDCNVAKNAFLAIGSLIESGQKNDRKILTDYYSVIKNCFANSGKPENFKDTNIMYEYQSYIASVLVSFGTGLKIELSKEETYSLYEILKSTFTQRGCLYEEGIALGCSLANFLRENYDFIFKDFDTYLSYQLGKYQETSLCSNALYGLSEVISEMGKSFTPYFDRYIGYIMKILQEQDADKSLKPIIILLFEDMFSFLPDLSYPHITNFMNYVFAAIDACMNFEDSSNIDLVEYFDNLKEKIIEFISTVLRKLAITNSSNENLFSNKLTQLISFIKFIVSDNNFNSELAVQVAGIIIDLITIYEKQVANYLDNDTIRFITRKLEESKSPDAREYSNFLQEIYYKSGMK